MAVEAGGFGIGWNKQTKKNCELAGILSKYYDGRKMEAYQMSGQLMYVNGVKVVNNDYTDEIRLNILENAFKKQINLGTENKYYSEFFPEGCDEDTRESVEKALQNSNSAEYKSAFIEWYLEGIGDGDHTSGQYYRN